MRDYQVIVLSSLTFIFLILTPLHAFCSPSFRLDSGNHRFSSVESGSKVSAEFEFRNDGDEDLIINEVKVTCDCTEAFAEPERLKPGEKGTIFVTLDTSYRVGDLDKEVIVVSNDPARPEVTLHIKGKTFLPLTFKPSPLFLDKLVPEKEAVADMTLMNTGKKPITVKKLLASEPDVELKISGKGDTNISLPYKLEIGDYLWVRVKLTPNQTDKGSLYRQVTVIADPAPITPLVMKIQGHFIATEGNTH
jgi:Protein of unknown function (DUF1573)